VTDTHTLRRDRRREDVRMRRGRRGERKSRRDYLIMNKNSSKK
jgi:hypothetical protein